jgi:hypothetical protein
MKKIFKLALNSTLLAIFLSMLALPIAFMGTAKYEEQPTVLSAQDSKEQNYEEKAVIRSVDDPEANIPENVREMILRMEQEYYETQEDNFPEDIERDQEKEQINVEDESGEEQNLPQEDDVEENLN